MIRRGKHHRRPARTRSYVGAGTWTGWGGLARYYAQTVAERFVDDYSVPRSHPTPIKYGKAPR